MNANTQIYDRIVNRTAMIRLYERRLKDKVYLIIKDHTVRVDKLIKEAKNSTKGFKILREAIDEDLLRTFNQVNRTSKASLISFIKDQISFGYQNIEATVGDIWRTKRPKRTIAENIVLKRPLYADKTLLQGWNNVQIGERRRLEKVIRKGIANGDTLERIAINVRKKNVHKITRNQSRTLVVTAMTSVRSQADQAIYMVNKDAIVGWQYIIILDSRTTQICVHRDGTIYPVDDTKHLPPAHYNCRSSTIPVFKSWKDLGKLEGVAQVRKRNLMKLKPKRIAFYDGLTPMHESYGEWLKRQSPDIQLRHLGDYKKAELFRAGQLTIDKFSNAKGNSIGLRDLSKLTHETIPGDTRRFAIAKTKLDAMQLGITSPEDLINSKKFQNTLRDYYKLQASELDGTLALTNYRGILLKNKSAMRKRVLSILPTEKQLRFNPITRCYEDTRLYAPNYHVLENNLKLVKTSDILLKKDKEFITSFEKSLNEKMGVNRRAVIVDNLRNVFTHYRKQPEPWANFKAVLQAQMKFDVINVSDSIETQLRFNANTLKKLLQDNYIDPVLGPIQLQELHDSFISNINKRNRWEDKIAPKIARELRGHLNTTIMRKNPIVWKRLNENSLQQFYLKVAHRLSLADTPDRDSFAIAIGRDLYNLANINGTRNKWYTMGMNILNDPRMSKFFKIETLGVQKRRMRSRMSGAYFGPYYDTLSYNLRVIDPRIQDYSKLTRKVELGMRLGVTTKKNRLYFREGFKTYFIKGKFGFYDTRIPIISTGGFSDFPIKFLDKNMIDALNWTSQAEYRIDKDFLDFANHMLYFRDDKGKAKYFNELNEYRKYMSSRGDLYERFKAMEWLKDKKFSNHAFIDHRARIYERGLIGPQSGETFRPFLNTAKTSNFSRKGFLNLQDQIGAFLGGIDDFFEGRFDGLTITGRQKISKKWRKELITIGNHMIRNKPNDIRKILENPLLEYLDGEEQGKFFRFAIEMAKLDKFLKGNYTKRSLETLDKYKIALALEQDASASGAQIIALTTRNKELAGMSNVIPTTQKRRLYDEVAYLTYRDPAFIKLNQRLHLTEKELRKASKMQSMVKLYGAGDRTVVLNVENKLSKVLEKNTDTLVIRASERDTVLNEISARIARYKRFDPETTAQLVTLRKNIRDVFNKGLHPGDELMEQLYFLDSTTKDYVQKLTANYSKIVTPEDFKKIANIMSYHLAEEVPILNDFTKFFGRLAEDFLKTAKPSDSAFDWKSLMKIKLRGSPKKGYTIPDRFAELFGIKAGESIKEKMLSRFGFWKPGSNLNEILNGVNSPATRKTGAKFFKFEVTLPKINIKQASFGKKKKIYELEVFKANKLPKKWTNVPWKNFDGKTIEQNFTQKFEERLIYKTEEGNYVTNILQVPQRTEATWWEQLVNESGKINDIADVTKARTAFAVNGNHSNDATLVKAFHLWGMKNNIPTSTVHDAFVANISQMLKAREALRKIYAITLSKSVIEDTLKEMYKRGLPKSLYKAYLNEAIDKGLIPVPGRSKIGGKILNESDILKIEDILEGVSDEFERDYYWYGIG